MTSTHVRTSQITGALTWVKERLSGLALIPLILWVLFAAIGLIGQPYNVALEWAGQSVNAVLMALALLVGVYHMQLGVRVVIEDYLRGPWERVLLALNLCLSLILGLGGLTLILMIALGAVPLGA